jgi:hypothetical protein
VIAAQASAARGIVEIALDTCGWPWARRLSLWLDALLIIEEQGGR